MFKWINGFRLHYYKLGTICYNPVRQKTSRSKFINKRNTSKAVLRIIAEENNILFGPVVNTVGKQQYNNTVKSKPKFKANTIWSDEESRNNTINQKSLVNTSNSPADIDRFQAKHHSNIQRSSNVKKLDTLLTFPLFKVTENSNSLIPSQPDTQILHSDSVQTLDRKSSLPSVSWVLERSRPPEEQAMLDRWKEKMISDLGEEGFAEWQKETFSRGHNLHSCIQKQLETGDGVTDLQESNATYWHSIERVLPDISEVQFTEKYCKHPHLRYHGYFDCVATYRDKLCLIEWKTSKRQKNTLSSTFDYPLQVAAYMGAVNFDQQYNLDIKAGLIVIAYEDGSPADVHSLEKNQCVHYWGSWLHRLYTYWRLTLQRQEQEQLSISSV